MRRVIWRLMVARCLPIALAVPRFGATADDTTRRMWTRPASATYIAKKIERARS